MIGIILALALCPPGGSPPNCVTTAERFFTQETGIRPCVQFADGTGGCFYGNIKRTKMPVRDLVLSSGDTMTAIDLEGRRLSLGAWKPNPTADYPDLRFLSIIDESATHGCLLTTEGQIFQWPAKPVFKSEQPYQWLFKPEHSYKSMKVELIDPPARLDIAVGRCGSSDSKSEWVIGRRKSDGKLVGWWSDNWEPVKGLPEIPVIDIRAGGGVIFCALTPERRLRCWETTGESYNIKVRPKGIRETKLSKSVSTDVVSFNFTPCVLNLKGEIYLPNEEDIPSGKFKDLYSCKCGIREPDGEVICWYGLPVPQPGGYFIEVSVDDEQGCALRQSGRPMCWWWSEDGRFEDPHETGWKLSVGQGHACLITDEGDPICWGHNEFGQSTPPTDSLYDLASAGKYTCGLTALGRMTCWGQGPESPLLDEGPFIGLDVSHWRVCGERADNTWACEAIGPWAQLDTGESFGPVASLPHLMSPPDGFDYAAEDAIWSPTEPPPADLSDWATTAQQACGLTADRHVQCYGRTPFQALPKTPLYGIDIGALGGCGITDDRKIQCFGHGRKVLPENRYAVRSYVAISPDGPGTPPEGNKLPEWDDFPPRGSEY